MPVNPTKQTIIDTAFALFRQKEYSQVTVNDICEACNITKTTFYYHLSSKEEIISGFYGSVIETLAARLVDVLAAENYWEQVMAVFFTLFDTSGKIGPDLYGQLMIMNLREDKGTFDLDEKLTEMMVMLIQRAQNAGQIRNSSEAPSLYRAAAHTFDGYELMWCIRNGAFDRKRVMRKALEDIFDVSPEFRKSSKGIEDALY